MRLDVKGITDPSGHELWEGVQVLSFLWIQIEPKEYGPNRVHNI